MKKKGFTLVELLVVITIIGILTAIILPSLSRVRENARRVVCLNNIKHLGMACLLYESDYGYFPPEGADASSSQQVYGHSWRRAILPYLGKDLKLQSIRKIRQSFIADKKEALVVMV